MVKVLLMTGVNVGVLVPVGVSVFAFVLVEVGVGVNRLGDTGITEIFLLQLIVTAKIKTVTAKPAFK